ncbi:MULTISPECIES: ComF family protein [Bacillaceae]|jgi:competence protein ComFC|uniref:ComF family protein n=1 Tax=Niallia hominis TaxID=3133173 RepID=A0ABV1EVL8_9BACI|nr:MULTISPECIES: ComF family protein [Bacillaceae]MCM3360950.1 ComF family protein [Niallia sp. MER TA 168]
MICVICLTPVTPDFNWTYLLSKEPECYLCIGCKEKLQVIMGETCQICGRPLDLLEAVHVEEGVCHDCCRWNESTEWKGILEANQSLFLYNDFLKETIARFKYRGDFRIAASFVSFLPKDFAKNKVVVPIPLSEERLYERGFNQVEAVLFYAKVPYLNCMVRLHSEKQSKKTRKERLQIENIFKLEQKESIMAQDILLVDDIYTTGSTLRNAAKVLKEAGAKSITSFTIAR